MTANDAINIDVVDGSKEIDSKVWDRASLSKAIRGLNVNHAVQSIIDLLGKRKIRRLRFFGHGLSTGGIIVGGNKSPNEKQMITIQNKTHVTNQTDLRKLRPYFSETGWVELHGCTTDEVTVIRIIRLLADLWDTRVKAAVGDQFTGSGNLNAKFEGQVIEADGTGKKGSYVTWK